MPSFAIPDAVTRFLVDDMVEPKSRTSLLFVIVAHNKPSAVPGRVVEVVFVIEWHFMLPSVPLSRDAFAGCSDGAALFPSPAAS